jgi:hypothetical protein
MRQAIDTLTVKRPLSPTLLIFNAMTVQETPSISHENTFYLDQSREFLELEKCEARIHNRLET